MTNPSTSILTTFAFLLVLLSCACDPCDNEPGTIEIDRSDRSAPVMYWQVVTQGMTSSGPISALTLIYSLDETVSVGADETMEITLLAIDNQSGISSLDIVGGFGYTCTNPGQAIVFDGIIPGNPSNFDLADGICAFEDAAYPVFIIDGTNLCTGSYPDLVSGGYELNGSATNANGISGLNRLVVNVIGDVEI